MNIMYMGLKVEALKAFYSLFGSSSIGVITQEDTRVDEFVSSHEALFCDCIHVPKKKTDAL